MKNIFVVILCFVFFTVSSPVKADLISASTFFEIVTPPKDYIHISDNEKTAEGAKNFIDTMGKRAIGFLSNSSLSKSQKQSQFKKLLRDSFDMKTIGRFALGKHWKETSAAQQQEYLKLFEAMVVEVYSARFDEYQGQDLDVRRAKARGTKDTLVTSYIVDQAGQEFKVDWMVRYKNGRYKIIDVIIEGVSMSITQRSDFSSVIQRGGGDVDVLLAHLKK